MEKSCRLYVRCHADEIARWKESANLLDLSFSSYVRLCLSKGPEISHIARVDPIIVRQLAAIGNNLNQIAKRVNISLTVKDRYMLEEVLEVIHSDLEQMLQKLEGR